MSFLSITCIVCTNIHKLQTSITQKIVYELLQFVYRSIEVIYTRHGTSNTPVTSTSPLLIPLRRKADTTGTTLKGRWPTTSLLLLMATANLSSELLGSRSSGNMITNEWVPDVLVCVITPHVRLDIQGSYIFFSPANRLARH